MSNISIKGRYNFDYPIIFIEAINLIIESSSFINCSITEDDK